MSYAGRLGLSHQEIFSLDPIANLAFAKNGIGDFTQCFCFHTSGMHCNHGSNLPYSKNTKCVQRFWCDCEKKNTKEKYKVCAEILIRLCRDFDTKEHIKNQLLKESS